MQRIHPGTGECGDFAPSFLRRGKITREILQTGDGRRQLVDLVPTHKGAVYRQLSKCASPLLLLVISLVRCEEGSMISSFEANSAVICSSPPRFLQCPNNSAIGRNLAGCRAF